MATDPVMRQSSSRQPQAKQLIVCGWDEVFLWQLDSPSKGCPRKTWSWRAGERADLPLALRSRFGTTDECKPAEDGRRILITSSGGAAAVVDRQEDRVLFHAAAPNAHSAELLPGERLVVASSHVPEGTGDRLLVFDLAVPDQPCTSVPLAWAHGVVWDAARERLYALGQNDLRIYSLVDWSSSAPRLQLQAAVSWPLAEPDPHECGHDLYPVPETDLLSVTTNRATWLFDRDTQGFRPHPLLANRIHVKSLCHHPDGSVVYVQAEGDHWWAERIHLCRPDGVLHVPGEHFYKARWDVAAG